MSRGTTFYQFFPCMLAPEEPSWQGFYRVERHTLPDSEPESEVAPLIGACLGIAGEERPSELLPPGEGEHGDAIFDEWRFRGSLEMLAYLYRLYSYWAERWGDEHLMHHPFVEAIPRIFESLDRWLQEERSATLMAPFKIATMRRDLAAVRAACGLCPAPDPDHDEGLDDDQPF